MAVKLAREMLEARVDRARAALSEHLATPCGAKPGSLPYRAYWGKHAALNNAHQAALKTLYEFELPQFDTPLFGLWPEAGDHAQPV